MIKVVLADDHKIMSEGIKLLLERDKDMKVVGYARNVEETAAVCAQTNPDIALMDISLLNFSGLGGIRQLKEKFPALKVVIFTGCSDAEMMLEAILSGVNGYIFKDISPDELIMAVKSAVAGLGIMHQDALFSIAQYASAYRQSCISQEELISVQLTDRELNIIRHIVEGKENREIAKSLFMSEGTIKNTISGILKKLELRDRIQLVVFAIRNRLVS